MNFVVMEKIVRLDDLLMFVSAAKMEEFFSGGPGAGYLDRLYK
jgi:hypothetical protein